MTVHEFSGSLDVSRVHADAPWWDEAYRAAFPDLLSHSVIRRDGWGQRAGVDRVLVLNSSKTLRVDEKVRREDFNDFALEFWSDYARRVPGWVAENLGCDYIAYAFIPSGRCYLLPFQELRRAWRANHQAWVETYRRPHHVAHNRENGRRWETWFVPVPIDEVLSALAESMLVAFTPQALEKAA